MEPSSHSDDLGVPRRREDARAGRASRPWRAGAASVARRLEERANATRREIASGRPSADGGEKALSYYSATAARVRRTGVLEPAEAAQLHCRTHAYDDILLNSDGASALNAVGRAALGEHPRLPVVDRERFLRPFCETPARGDGMHLDLATHYLEVCLLAAVFRASRAAGEIQPPK